MDLSGTPRLALARVLSDHLALDGADLNLEAGDTVVITRALGKDWLFGHVLSEDQAKREPGLFPASIVELIQGSEVAPGPLVFNVQREGAEGSPSGDADGFSDSLSTSADSSRRPASTRRGALYGGLISPTGGPTGNSSSSGGGATRANATKSIRGLFSIAPPRNAAAPPIAPSAIPALILRQKESGADGGTDASDGEEERVLSVVVPYAERKFLLSTVTANSSVGGGVGELHSYYCIDVRTTHRIARVEKRFSDLRAFDAQLRALCPEVYTKTALENVDAALDVLDEESAEVEDDAEEQDESGAAAKAPKTPSSSGAAAAVEAASSRGGNIKVDVSLQHASLMSAKRTSEVMERRRHAAARFLHLAFLARRSIADLLLAFLIGPLPGSKLDRLIGGELDGGHEPSQKKNSLLPAASGASSRGLLAFPSQALGTRVDQGASASSRRLGVPSLPLSANRDPSLPPLDPLASGAAAPAGRAFPATALPAAPERSFGQSVSVSRSESDAFIGTLSISLSDSPVSASFSVPSLLTTSAGSAGGIGIGIGADDGASSGPSSGLASQVDDATSPLPPLPPVFDTIVCHRKVGTAGYLEAGSSVPFSLDSLDAFDQLMEQGWAVIGEEEDSASPSPFAAAGDPLDLPPALHTTVGAGQEGSAAEEPLLWNAIRKASSLSPSDDEASAWSAAWPSAVPAVDLTSTSSSSEGCDSLVSAPLPPCPSSGPLSFPRTGQQVVVSYTALVWDGGSTSGKVLECVERAVFNLNDFRKAEETVPRGLHEALRRIQVGKTATVVLGPDAAYGQEGIKARSIPQAAHLVYARLKVHAVLGYPRPMPAADFSASSPSSSSSPGGKARLGMVVPSSGSGAVDDDMLAAAHLILGSPSSGGSGRSGGSGGSGGSRAVRTGAASVAAPPSLSSAAPPAAPQQYGSAHGLRAEKTASGVVMPSPAEAEAALRAYLASIGQEVPAAAASSDGGSGSGAGKEKKSGFLSRLFTSKKGQTSEAAAAPSGPVPPAPPPRSPTASAAGAKSPARLSPAASSSSSSSSSSSASGRS